MHFYWVEVSLIDKSTLFYKLNEGAYYENK